ncbi:hypothetical protein CEXT_536921 [Caerostris extrusa]|uniref:Ycf15 n=1 Tax=Caerostris extrusa TaxID=172846 RepID=A0AAV4P601_CAEEX|nr:hypothetical protein CEXT_536921 [Caerostris extrusa]
MKTRNTHALILNESRGIPQSRPSELSSFKMRKQSITKIHINAFFCSPSRQRATDKNPNWQEGVFWNEIVLLNGYPQASLIAFLLYYQMY